MRGPVGTMTPARTGTSTSAFSRHRVTSGTEKDGGSQRVSAARFHRARGRPSGATTPTRSSTACSSARARASSSIVRTRSGPSSASSSGGSPRSSSTSPDAEREQAQQVPAQAEAVAVARVEHRGHPRAGLPRHRRDRDPRDRRARRRAVRGEHVVGQRGELGHLTADRVEVRTVRDVDLGDDVEGHATSESAPVSTS